MVERTIAILDPTARPRAKGVPTAPRVDDLNGKVLGILWNRKPNGDILLRRVKELLSERFRFGDTIWRQKFTASVPAGSEVIRELADSADVVINGQGD